MAELNILAAISRRRAAPAATAAFLPEPECCGPAPSLRGMAAAPGGAPGSQDESSSAACWSPNALPEYNRTRTFNTNARKLSRTSMVMQRIGFGHGHGRRRAPGEAAQVGCPGVCTCGPPSVRNPIGSHNSTKLVRRLKLVRNCYSSLAIGSSEWTEQLSMLPTQTQIGGMRPLPAHQQIQSLRAHAGVGHVDGGETGRGQHGAG